MIYPELTSATRALMGVELEMDIRLGRAYQSPRLHDTAQARWLSLLREAIGAHDDAWLTQAIQSEHLLRTTEMARSHNGVRRPRRVPASASDTLAEGEFNHYYVRAVALRAIEMSALWGTDPMLEVVRGKDVHTPRESSEAWLVKTVSAPEVLQSLREHASSAGGAPGIPGGPNSGITVRLPHFDMAT